MVKFNYTETYSYDDDNRITQLTAGSLTSSYVYDTYSRMTSITNKYNNSSVVTTTIGYLTPSSSSTTSLVNTWKNTSSGSTKTYTYAYDSRGNITSISDGTYTTSYEYDQYDQLTRENNQQAGKTWVYDYDDAGNILTKKEYAYTTGTLGNATDTISYGYTDSTWKELLTSYDGKTVSYDGVGNITSDGTWNYTWEHGRQLKSASNGSTSVSYKYNADGMRLSKTVGSTTTKYYYVGDKLIEMTQGSNKLHFIYDAAGPAGVNYNGTQYYYLKNAQGDVLGIVNSSGALVVSYTYDAWGNVLSTTGSMATTLGALNPLRYRGYVYDTETELYYLQSRYYDPSIGRFIAADAFISTGQGNLGTNMYAYCNNNPVNFADPTGTSAVLALGTATIASLIAFALVLLSAPGASEDFIDGILSLIKELKIAAGAYATPSYVTDDADEQSATRDVVIPQKNDNKVVFPENPMDFNPMGLVPVLREGSKNGIIITWMDPISNKMVFRWDENLNKDDGPHYHINGIDFHFEPEVHLVPEPYASIYFPFG